MFTRAKTPGIKALALSILLALGGFSGCVTRPNWNQRIGTYTYPEAVKELGSQGSATTYPDGVMVVEWLVEKAPRNEIGFGVEGDPAGPSTVFQNKSGLTPNTFDHYLRLTFGSDGKLRKWSREYH